MEYRRLGRSGLQLSVVSFGSWVSFKNQIDDNAADELMGIAYDHGINFFDNAETYADGESEKMMGRVLRRKNWDRSSFVVSSKVYFGRYGRHFKPNQKGLNRKHVMEACEEALQRLQVDYLDLYFCHRPDRKTPIEETVFAMNTLLEQNKILYWGTSEWSGVEIMDAHRIAAKYNLIGPVMEQPQYNLFEREKVEKEFDRIYDSVGLGTTIWSPLASGLLTGKYNHGIPEDSRLNLPEFAWLKEKWMKDQYIEKVKALSGVADELGVSMPALAIAWCLKNPHVTTAILGATKKEQLLQNLEAVSITDKLTEEVMQKIEEIMQNKPQMPEH